MQLPSKKFLPAFTLVELIVVITIVGILSTVGFVSYSGYLSGARDSNRISQLTKLSDSLQTYAASKSLPLPDNAIEITASGTLIAYQGEVGVDVLETIDYTNGGTDPKDDSYYTYYLTKDRNSLQLMALMEEAQSVSYQFPNTPTNQAAQVHANFEDRFPKVYGRKLGVLTYSDAANPELLNTPANQISANTLAGELDIVQTTTTYTANISDDTGSKITGTGGVLISVNPQASCKRIKQSGKSNGNGIYTINPLGEDFQVYCDMETDGGGWTAATMLADTTTQNLFDTGNTEKITSITQDISSKGTISDIWVDDEDKDIMLQCFTDDSRFKSYEIPFIIYDFSKSDIGNLEKAIKQNTTFSSTSLEGKWKNYTFSISTNYGGSTSPTSFYLQANSGGCFLLPTSTGIFIGNNRPLNCPSYFNIPEIAQGINSNNYCISFIK